MAECWNTRKTRHEEKDVLKNLPANGANAVERRIGVNMNNCINYLCKKKENHMREMMCKNK